MNQSKSRPKIGSSPLLILFKNFIYLFFYYYHVFWKGGGGNPLHGIYRVVLQKPRFKHYASCCIVFSALSAVCGVCSLTKWQDGSSNLFYSRYSLFIISGYGAFSSTWAAARQISWDKRKVSHEKKSLIHTGWVWDANLAAVSLMWGTNMADVTSCKTLSKKIIVCKQIVQHTWHKGWFRLRRWTGGLKTITIWSVHHVLSNFAAPLSSHTATCSGPAWPRIPRACHVLTWTCFSFG